jgi:hypothetical protein
MTDLREVTIVIPEGGAASDVVIGDPGVLPTVLEKLRLGAWPNKARDFVPPSIAVAASCNCRFRILDHEPLRSKDA